MYSKTFNLGRRWTVDIDFAIDRGLALGAGFSWRPTPGAFIALLFLMVAIERN